MAKKRQNRPTVYYLIITLTAALLCIGLVMIASASSVVAYVEHKDSFFFLWRQLGYALIGLVALLIASRMRRDWFKRLALPAIGAAVLLLFAVLIFGEEAGGARRWLVLGGFRFQPSEFAKLAVVLFAADLLSRKRKQPERLTGIIKPLGGPVILVAGLIMLQPDLGTTLIILVSVFTMLYLANIRLRELFVLAATGFAGIAGLIVIEPYRLRRVTAFLDPWADPRRDGYQLIQSLLALGSGGWTGVGLGLSRQKFGYLPAPYTDFIFSIIGEELGLVGTLAVVVLFILLAFAIAGVIFRCADLFGKLLAGGLGSMIISQAFINIGGVTSMMPMTGVPLPFISFGGTSLVLTMISIGILLNLAKQNRPKGKKGANLESADMRRRNSGARLSRSSAGRSA